jgi:hypothetical protein
VPAFQPAVLANIKQSDGTSFKAKPLPKAFNNFKNAAYKSGGSRDSLSKSTSFRKSPIKKAR